LSAAEEIVIAGAAAASEVGAEPGVVLQLMIDKTLPSTMTMQ
jgi:hypothetical protein